MSFKTFMNKNGSTIMLFGSIALTVGAIISAVKKSKEGAKVREEYEEEIAEADGNAQLETEAKINYVKKTAKVYSEAIIFGTAGITLACISHRTDAKKITQLGTALAFNEERVKKLYNYIERKLEPHGMSKKDIERDMAEKDPDAPFTPTEKPRKRYRKEEPVVFKDSYSGTQFESTLKDYYAACDRAELILSRHGAFGLGYNKWMGLLGLQDTPAGATVGWKPGDFKSYIQEAMIDGLPVYIICYKEYPNSEYWR